MNVAYSCVTDRLPHFEFQTLVWIWTLKELAGVAPDRLYCHLVKGGERPAYRTLLETEGVNIIPIEPFGDGKYCNKIAQLAGDTFKDYDNVILCDTDTAYIEDIAPVASDHLIKAMLVGQERPAFPILARLYRMAGLPIPTLAKPVFNTGRTFANNFNGGLYILPASLISQFYEYWAKWAFWCLDHTDIMGDHALHCDQVSFGMAMVELDIGYEQLDVTYNCTNRYPEHALSIVTRMPRMVHYHTHFDRNAMLLTSGNPHVDAAVERINAVIGGHMETLLNLQQLHSRKG